MSSAFGFIWSAIKSCCCCDGSCSQERSEFLGEHRLVHFDSNPSYGGNLFLEQLAGVGNTPFGRSGGGVFDGERRYQMVTSGPLAMARAMQLLEPIKEEDEEEEEKAKPKTAANEAAKEEGAAAAPVPVAAAAAAAPDEWHPLLFKLSASASSLDETDKMHEKIYKTFVEPAEAAANESTTPSDDIMTIKRDYSDPQWLVDIIKAQLREVSREQAALFESLDLGVQRAIANAEAVAAIIAQQESGNEWLQIDARCGLTLVQAVDRQLLRFYKKDDFERQYGSSTRFFIQSRYIQPMVDQGFENFEAMLRKVEADEDANWTGEEEGTESEIFQTIRSRALVVMLTLAYVVETMAALSY